MANCCVASDPDSHSYRKLVYDIENDWYAGNHPLKFTQQQEMAQHHIDQLQRYRERVKADYSALSFLDSTLDSDNIFDAENIDRALAFAKEIFNANQASTESFLKISRNIIESSMSVLKQYGMEAPCHFVVIALGSAAREEVTPYSDLEYAFIVEENPSHEYFLRLAVDTYFRIGNVRESPPKIFDVDELKSNKVLKETASRCITTGFRIDGIMSVAGNIPTGLVEGKGFTMTVDEFMKVYELSAIYPLEDEKSGDKAEMLSSTVVVYTNEGQTSKLYKEIQRRRIEYESTNAKADKEFNKKRLLSFSRDIESYMFLPEFVKYQPPENLNVKVKADIFRYPTLLANNIKICLTLSSTTSWEVYRELKERNFLSENNYNYLIIVLALSMYTRTSSYIAAGTQASVIVIDPHSKTSTDGLYRVPLNLFVTLGCLLVPIKRSVLQFLEGTDLSMHETNMETFVKELTSSIHVNASDFFLKAEVLYFAGDYDNSLNVLCAAIDTQPDCLTYATLVHQLDERIELPPIDKRKCIELCSYLLYVTRNYSCAVDYFKSLNVDNPEQSILWQLLTAYCMKEMGKCEDASMLLKKVC